jgi:flagellar protein FlaJ
LKRLDLKFEPWTYAYRVLGDRVQRFLPHFNDLHIQMKSGGVPITLPAYISLMVFAAALAFIIPLAIFPFVLPFMFGMRLISIENMILSLLFALLSSVATFILLYLYPGIKSSNRRTPMDVNLPYFASFLTLLANSNIPPRKIFGSIAQIPTLTEVRLEFNHIVRDVEVFGKDLLTSIMENMTYIPSKRLQELLSGYVATIRTGGDTSQYLQISTENLMKERMIKLDMMLESLYAFAEIYIMILVAAPLLFIVLFATIGMLGGFGMDPGLLMMLLTYAGIPLMAAILIVILDTYNVS